METLGVHTRVEKIDPPEFQKVLASLHARLTAVTLGVEITWIKAIFKFGVENRIVPPVYFGSEFKPPDAVDVKRHKRSRPKREFSVDEVRLFLAHANPTLKAAILLGINSGIGNADVARLQRHHIDFDRSWIDFARGKTEVDRHIPMWPETAEALKAAWKNRPEPKKGSRRPDGLANCGWRQLDSADRRGANRSDKYRF